jgi:hypothetical protein
MSGGIRNSLSLAVITDYMAKFGNADLELSFCEDVIARGPDQLASKQSIGDLLTILTR